MNRRYDFDWLRVFGNVHDVLVDEAAHHIDDAIGFANGGEKLVAQPLAFRRAGNEPGNIHELYDGRLHLLRLDDGGEFV